MTYTLDQFCEYIPDDQRPPLDRETVNKPLSEYQMQWRTDGYIVLENFIPDDLIDAYVSRFIADNSGTLPANADRIARGYGIGTPYMKIPQIKDLCLYAPLIEVLADLIGDEMGMHLNLTGWKSTERNWHQDDYLNPSFVNGHYAAVWFALGNIQPDAGPFEFVPGSHVVLPVCRGELVKAALPESERGPDWPRAAEKILDELYEKEIRGRNMRVHTWRGRKGDVLIWHPWLLHRGSKPTNPDAIRPAIITHYSALSHRHDMAVREMYANGESKGWFFVF